MIQLQLKLFNFKNVRVVCTGQTELSILYLLYLHKMVWKAKKHPVCGSSVGRNTLLIQRRMA